MPRGNVKPFPTITFEDALVIGNAIQEIASGEKVRRLTLFDHIKKSPDSGPSRQLIINSNKYGITAGGNQADFLELTQDGKLATSSEVSEKDRIESRFKLSIKKTPIFDYLYEKIKNNKLPSKQVIIDYVKENDIKDDNVAEECIDLFIINLKFIGLLRTMSGIERIITVEQRLEETEGKIADKVIEFSEVRDIVPKISHENIEESCFYITPIGEEGSEQRKHSDLFLVQ